MLNPEFGWKGKVKNLDEYRKERDELERREKKRERTQNNLKLVKLSKEDKIIQAIKEGKVNVEEFYSLLHKDKEDEDQE